MPPAKGFHVAKIARRKFVAREAEAEAGRGRWPSSLAPPERSRALLSEESGQSGEIGQIEACIRHIRDEVAGIRRAVDNVRDIQVVQG